MTNINNYLFDEKKEIVKFVCGNVFTKKPALILSKSALGAKRKSSKIKTKDSYRYFLGDLKSEMLIMP